MAVLSATNPTLLDMAQRLDPNGSIATIGEILNETNEILPDMAWVEGNLPTGHVATIRSGLPIPTWRKINQGVTPGKSRTVQITASCGMLEAYAEVDVDLAKLNGNTNEFRLSEDKAHIEGMNQEMADTTFYGNEGTEPDAFTGLSPHYNDLSAANAENILVGGGAGTDNGSIWLVVWGETSVYGIVPKGSQAGLSMTNKGQVTINNSDGTRMEAFQTHYQWKAGLIVKDWRYAVRIPNIDKSLLSTIWTAGAFATGADLPNLMFQAMRRIPNLGVGRPAFYMSRDMATTVAQQTTAKGQGSTLTTDKVGGDMKFTEYYHGIPMRRVDALSADEALVS